MRDPEVEALRERIAELEEQLEALRSTLLHIASADWSDDDAAEVLDELQVLAAHRVEDPNTERQPE